MATIDGADGKEIILVMLQNEGVYPGDPQIARIYKYENQYGETMYAIFLMYEHDDINRSPYVSKPELLFDKAEGLTDAGEIEKTRLEESYTVLS